MVVRSNMNAMNANRNLSKNNHAVGKAIEKLVSGYDLNRAADDASGLAVSERMRSQITGLDQGTSNAIEGVGLVQTAEGGMEEIHNMLNRLVELATKAANGTISDEVDREAIQAEADALIIEIDRIAESTNYNGIPLLGGMYADELISSVPKIVDMIFSHTEYFTDDFVEEVSTDPDDEYYYQFSNGLSYSQVISKITAANYKTENGLVVNKLCVNPNGQLCLESGQLVDIKYDSSSGEVTLWYVDNDGKFLYDLNNFDITDIKTNGVYTSLSTSFSDDKNLSSQIYVSDVITVPDEAKNIPIEDGYEVTFTVVLYEDVLTDVDDEWKTTTPNIVTLDFTLSIEGGRVIGSDGVDYTDLTYTTNADKYYDPFGDLTDPENQRDYEESYYIPRDADGNLPTTISASSMEMIMGAIIDRGLASYTLNVGVLSAPDVGTVVLPEYDKDGNFQYEQLFDYWDEVPVTDADGNPTYDEDGNPYTKFVAVYKNGDMILQNKTTDYPRVNGEPYPAPYGYGDYSYSKDWDVSRTYGSYGNSLQIYSDDEFCDWRVLGVEINVTNNGGDVIPSTGSPDGFLADNWDSTSDVFELDDTIILDVSSVPEPEITEGTVSVPKTYDELIGMTQEQRDALIVTVSHDLVASNYDPDVDTKTEYYVTMWESEPGVELTKAQINALFPDYANKITIIYGSVDENGEPNEPEHYVIEKMCDQIEEDFGITATRKLDNTDDVSLDANFTLNPDGTTKYIIQLGRYVPQEWYYGQDDIYDPELGYLNTYEKVEDPIILHVADQNETYNKIYIYINPMTGEALEIKPLDLSTVEMAGAAIKQIKNAINYTSDNRANLGAIQNRLEKTVNANNNTSENMTSAESAIRDADMAKVMMEYTKMNIITQASQSMLAQANESIQQVLSLLG